MDTAVGQRAYCLTCFHGWRTQIDTYSYSATAMCSLGTSDDRLMGQVRFFAPFCPPSARVLEIGCATGELAAAVRKELSPACYEAIELSPAGDQALPHLDRLYKQPLRELISSNAIDGGFDLILMSHVLEHLADPAAELAAMLEVLGGNGAIFLEVPNKGGHRLLPIDDNRSHLHFFSASSLCRLLSNYGLEVTGVETNARLDARYADSLRAIAKPFALPRWDHTMLSRNPRLEPGEKIVIWGAGSLASEVIANFFDPARIDYFIDTDPAKQGGMLLGKQVRAPDALGSAPRTVLINSVDFASAITADLRRLYPDTSHRLVPIADLLDDLPVPVSEK
jgi:SAM-dependent methyltransferase